MMTLGFDGSSSSSGAGPVLQAEPENKNRRTTIKKKQVLECIKLKIPQTFCGTMATGPETYGIVERSIIWLILLYEFLWALVCSVASSSSSKIRSFRCAASSITF